MKESANSFYPKPIFIDGVVKCEKIPSELLLYSSKPPFSMLDIRLEAYHIGRYPKGENVSFITIKSVRVVSAFLKVVGK